MGEKDGSTLGHSAFGAGVTVTIVETSNVGVKVGMVGRGVMDAVGVCVGRDVAVAVGIGDRVVVELLMTRIGVAWAAGAHALTNQTKLIMPITSFFMGVLYPQSPIH